MNKRMERRKRRKRRKNSRLALLSIIIFVLFIGFFGKNNRWNLFKNDTASAISIENNVDKIGRSHPINKEIENRTKEEKLKQLQIQREKEEAERIKEKNKGKKIAYLTFDDGPSTKGTPMVLNVLKKYDIKATFFVVGNMVEQNPDILKRVYDEGHQIGNHTYGHDYGYLYSSAKNFMNDIYKAEKLIKDVVGDEFDSKIIRFPGGSFEARKAPMKKAVADAGYRDFDWNALNGDAEGIGLSESYLINTLRETVAGKQKVIILMHDTDQKISTAKTLGTNIEFLLNEGYEFQILDKNFSWE